ncbi:hypothetical protein [Pseudoalteromonas luteoviolacea]|uniref:Uncharacterized protein n=1 Tax=Pseudoalteromonas luteoviolacea H33 TaxID=1365251 RepID=A0A167FRW5_9GAMM|nr:hypothetical protein [Pseudoalteromonas luteoviolacea]KZN52717.1 hypothetical protein N476_09800 [Pseudoalteromonas luteoviolacea H33]KZN73847.1 hypothetical protein N477_22775 [Pseudoalteromonas luteoviolacea H33-S]
MQDSQYSIYYKNKSAKNLNESSSFVQSNYIIAVKSLESGNFLMTFMQGFDEFLVASLYPSGDINLTTIGKCAKFEFIIFNDPDYGIYISQKSMPDEQLLNVLSDVTKCTGQTFEDIFQLLQSQIIRDFSVIQLSELDNMHLEAGKEQVLEQSINRSKLVKHEKLAIGSKCSTLDIKRILWKPEGDEFDTLVADGWNAIRSDKVYQSTALQYVSHELDNTDQLAYYEFVYQSWVPSQHKHIERKIIRID